MAERARVLRQWLETEAAFGVSEVPVATRSKNSSTKSKAGKEAAPAAETRRAHAPNPPAAAAVVRPQRASEAPVSAVRGRSAHDVPAPEVAKKVAAVPAPPPAGDIAKLPAISRKQKEAALAALQQQIEKESAAYLSDVATRVVFGEGDPDAKLLFVGEGPGADEDRTGRPFVGRSGQLLDKMIVAVGYTREQVYIANVVKLRCAIWAEGANGQPRLQDRPPNPEEVVRGIAYLHRQIEIIRPAVIVTLGSPAVKHLTGTLEGITKLRGTWLSYRGIPVMPTYHPSFVLRAYTEENRRKVWGDLKAAAKRVKELSE